MSDHQVTYDLKVTHTHDDVDDPAKGNRSGKSKPFDKYGTAANELAPGGSDTILLPVGIAALKILASNALDVCVMGPPCGEGDPVQQFWHLKPIPEITEESETDDALAIFFPLDGTKPGPKQLVVTNPSAMEDVSYDIEWWA